jgi:hypothetical protein
MCAPSVGNFVRLLKLSPLRQALIDFWTPEAGISVCKGHNYRGVLSCINKTGLGLRPEQIEISASDKPTFTTTGMFFCVLQVYFQELLILRAFQNWFIVVLAGHWWPTIVYSKVYRDRHRSGLRTQNSFQNLTP